MTELLDRVRGALVGLKMPRAMEALDHTVQRLERGEITDIEAIDALLSEEYVTRESRRIDTGLSPGECTGGHSSGSSASTTDGQTHRAPA